MNGNRTTYFVYFSDHGANTVLRLTNRCSSPHVWSMTTGAWNIFPTKRHARIARKRFLNQLDSKGKDYYKNGIKIRKSVVSKRYPY